MRVYISGRITGLPREQVEQTFGAADALLRAFGHDPVNPLDNGLDPNALWGEHMAADIAMLLRCDAIYLLDGWSESRGARIESYIAQECGLKFFTSTKI